MVEDPTASGYLLLTLPSVEAWLPGATRPTKGSLAVECITLPLPASLTGSRGDERDVWLVLRISSHSSFSISSSSSYRTSTSPNVARTANNATTEEREEETEIPISATQIVFHDRAQRLFRFLSYDSTTDDWEVRVSEPRTEGEREDLETFEVVLGQYAAVEGVSGLEGRVGSARGDAASSGDEKIFLADARSPSSSTPSLIADLDPDLRNQLVLVDESSGEVLGHLASNVRIREDESVRARGNEKAPVVVDLPSEEAAQLEGEEEEVYVRTIPDEGDDWVMRSAHLLSRGIIHTTSLLTSSLSLASSYYVSKATPNEKPLEFSETTKTTIARVHHLSGEAVRVSKKTTGLINRAVEGAASRLGGGGRGKEKVGHGRARSFQYQHHLDVGNLNAPPPLPARSGSRSRSRSPSPQPPPYTFSTSLAPSPGPSTTQMPQSSFSAPQPQSASQSTPPLKRKLPLLNRLLLSTDLLLTTLESSGKHLLEQGSERLSEAVGHKYGKDAGDATRQLGASATNVGVVYIDARGVGRRALLRRAGKGYVRARLGGRDVEIGVPGAGAVDAGSGTVGTIGTSSSPPGSGKGASGGAGWFGGSTSSATGK